MWIKIYFLFSYVIFFYSISYMLLLLFLAIQSIRAQRRMDINMPDDDTIRYILKGSPITPKVSVIAPAYNEEVDIIDNVTSLLGIYYPDLEVIIVNDASTDKTLELLIDEYDLVQVPFTNALRVPSKPIKAVYRSQDPKFSKLTVVDKEHGGRKSDATNAGLNICTSRYFVSTDVDCIIEPMALYRMMWHVVNSHDTMIGVGASMLMLNGCTVEEGRVTEPAVSLAPLPLYQQLEYMRSYLIAKMGWSKMNALPNISGGFGLFDTDVVVKSGGYDPTSMAEDMDMLLRMITYMKNTGQPFRTAQIPQVCCWTEGPFTLLNFYRQRKRWARGLCEIVSNHAKLFFNPHYGTTGAFTLPYVFVFEFIAPILEVSGFFFLFWLVFNGRVNWGPALAIFSMIYLFSVAMTFLVLVYDYSTQAVKWKSRFWSYTKLVFAGLTEPLLYHPIVLFCTLVGYWNYLRGSAAIWTSIQRRGRGKKEESKDKEQSEGKTNK